MKQIHNIPERLAEAYRLAEKSPDPSNQNGAVIYQFEQQIGFGYNHFYVGVPPNVDDRAKKYERIVHAETDACLSLSRSRQVVTDKAVMYCPWAACRNCAISILGSGIKTLVVHADRCRTYAATRGIGSDMQEWQPEVDEALQWLVNGGVHIEVFEGPVPSYFGPGIKINERFWNPSTLEFR